jgi:hypothetical protein
MADRATWLDRHLLAKDLWLKTKSHANWRQGLCRILLDRNIPRERSVDSRLQILLLFKPTESM